MNAESETHTFAVDTPRKVKKAIPTPVARRDSLEEEVAKEAALNKKKLTKAVIKPNDKKPVRMSYAEFVEEKEEKPPTEEQLDAYSVFLRLYFFTYGALILVRSFYF